MLSILTKPTDAAHALAPRSDVLTRSISSAGPLAPVNTGGGWLLSTPVPRIRGGLPPKVLKRVRDYIEAHLEERMGLESLARIAGLSISHFARAFKQSEGVTPHDYLVQRRVKRAMDLLACTDLALSEIALAVGFADQSHCCRQFRKQVGVCPRDYRWSTR